MLRSRTWLCVLTIFALSVNGCTSAEEFYVAHWNVENLFDTEDDPSVERDEEFTPTGPKRWTPERLEIKLRNLAHIIGKMNGGRGPDVLGLCEIENRGVVEMLRDKLAPLDRKYEIVHQDSPSDGGIDCALLYDADVFSLVEAKFHFVDANKTRDILEARLRRDGVDLYVFVNHWPSRRNDEWQRISAATVLRKRLDEILAADPKADILLVGDFNDEPENISLRDHLRAAISPEKLEGGLLYNTTAPISAAGKGTFVYDNRWNLLDQIIISAGMLDEAGFQWKRDSSRRLEYRELFFHPNYPGAIPRPNKSYSENRFHKSGYSDHLPVGCMIVREAKPQ